MPHTVRDGLDLGRRSDDLVWAQAALGVYEMGGENGVDESRFAQPSLACFCPQQSFDLRAK